MLCMLINVMLTKKKHAHQFCGTLPLSTVRAHELINGESGIKREAGKIL